MQFQFRHIGRPTYPQKHILIVEDTITHQIDILKHLGTIFEHQGIVQLSVVPGALAAASIIGSGLKIDVIILDHDLPEGNGSDLMLWMKERGLTIPVITFSGIPQNNNYMMSLGATHNFGKGEVICGMADGVIKAILGLNEKNVGIAEFYMNTHSPQTTPMTRYWITPKILVGGNITSAADWAHLEKDFGIKGVINVDGGNSDKDYGASDLLERNIEDNGGAFAADSVCEAVAVAKKHRDEPIYVHCHMGCSRSPHFVYAILRGLFKLSTDDARATVWNALPSPRHQWGFNNHTASYTASIEAALENWTV